VTAAPTSSLGLSHPVPFLDVNSMNQEVMAEIEQGWESVVSSGSFVGGPEISRFEEAFADFCGTKHAVGVANGTDALELVLRALGIGPGDEVIIPTNTFIATPEAVRLCGATPRFVDVDERSLLVSPDAVEAAIGPSTAAIIPVHLYGHMAPMDAIVAIGKRHNIPVIEDAAQAHGSTWLGRSAGSFGAAGCFSFYPGKNLGAFGDAGAIVTNDDSLYETLALMTNHGRSRASKYLHPLLGRNSRLDSLQAVVLSAKLNRLCDWNGCRRAAVDVYQLLLEDLPVSIVQPLPGCVSSYHLNVVRVPGRDGLLERLRKRGVDAAIHYPVPCHLQAAYRTSTPEHLPVAERAAKEILSLPLSPHMSINDVERVASALRDEALTAA
jgi:dTDP-4-amino-4,6-dideoxygalactose transaminase